MQHFTEMAGGLVGEEEPGSSHVASAAQCLWSISVSIPFQRFDQTLSDKETHLNVFLDCLNHVSCLMYIIRNDLQLE